MYPTPTPDPSPVADRFRDAIDRSRGPALLGALALIAALGMAVGLVTTAGRPALDAGPLDLPARPVPSTGASEPSDPSGPAGSPTLGGFDGSGSAGPQDPADPVAAGGSGRGGQSGSGSPAPSDPGTDPDPDPAPREPVDQPPTISDVEVETSGMTVVVRYRAADPDGDEVRTTVDFGDPVRPNRGERPEAPQQGPATDRIDPGNPGGAGGSGGGSGGTGGRFDLPTVPGGEMVVDGDTGGSGDDEPQDDGPRPIGDGRYEARHTYDRDRFGTEHLASITIVVEDGAGGEARETVEVHLEAST